MIRRLGDNFDHKFYTSVFRVFAALLLIKETIQLWLYVPVLFQQDSFVVTDQRPLFGLSTELVALVREHIFVVLGLYLGLLILFLFGIGKRATAFSVFIIYYFLEKLCPLILNGGDNLLGFLLLYLSFIDCYNYFSLTQLNYKRPESRFISNFISGVFTFCICFHLVAVYLTTALHKIHSDVWFHGIAVYYTFQLERFEGTRYNVQMAKNVFLVTFITYYTVFVEMFYPTLVWFKSTRKLIICCAIMMHIGIYVFMMIYDFQLIFIVLQGFFFNDREWLGLINKIKTPLQKRYPQLIKA